MKRSITIYLAVAGIVLAIIGYWYFTRSSVLKDSRMLIATSKIKAVATSNEPPAMTKEEAYERRSKETEADKMKLDLALENERPEKLAASVARAMQSPYEKKREELRSERSTIPVYKGKSYSDQQDDESGNVSPLVVSATTASGLKEFHSAPRLATQVVVQPIKKKKIIAMEKQISADVSVKEDLPKENEDVFNSLTIVQPKEEPKVENSSVSFEPDNESNAIKACVFGDQTLKAGGMIIFRLLEKATIDGKTYERNTTFSGRCNFGTDRLLVVVDKIPSKKGGFSKVNLTVHDPNDLQEGIYAPSDMTKEGAVDAATSSVEKLIGSVGTPGMTVGAGVARIFRSAINGNPKVTVFDGHSVLFLTKTP